MKLCLIVCENAPKRQKTRFILEDMGFICVEAEDGEFAFVACQALMPDVILLDSDVLWSGGSSFVKKIRSVKGGHQPQIIFCGSGTSAHLHEEILLVGANSVLSRAPEREALESEFVGLGLLKGVLRGTGAESAIGSSAY